MNTGGVVENRARLLLDIVNRISAAIRPDRVGVRLSPFGQYGGIHDSQPLQLFTFAIRLSKRSLAYLHLIEARGSEIGLGDALHEEALNNAQLFRASFAGPIISAADYLSQTAAQTIELGHADAIAFGRLFIANPDLVERIKGRLPLNAYNRATFYGGDERSFTDYKVYEQQ